jgi:hypothetical protein
MWLHRHSQAIASNRCLRFEKFVLLPFVWSRGSPAAGSVDGAAGCIATPQHRGAPCSSFSHNAPVQCACQAQALVMLLHARCLPALSTEPQGGAPLQRAPCVPSGACYAVVPQQQTTTICCAEYAYQTQLLVVILPGRRLPAPSTEPLAGPARSREVCPAQCSRMACMSDIDRLVWTCRCRQRAMAFASACPSQVLAGSVRGAASELWRGPRGRCCMCWSTKRWG